MTNDFGNAVTGATITVLDGPDAGKQAVANQNGMYRFEELMVGNANFAARGADHFDDRRGTFINGTNTLNFTMKKSVITFTATSRGCNISGNCGSSAMTKEGVSLPGSYSRGFNIVGINPATGESLGNVRSFDTWQSSNEGTAMRELMTHINDFPIGTLILITVTDEAGLTRDSFACLPNPTPASICCAPLPHTWVYEFYELSQSLGAIRLRSYCYRNSYSFITVKGQGAKAESLVNAEPAVTTYTIRLQ